MLTEKCIDAINHAQPITTYLTRAARYRDEYACPFCESDHHVKVFPETNSACCMKCRKSFDLITAKMEYAGLEFLDAAKEIAEREGVTLEYEESNQTTKAKEKTAPDPMKLEDRKDQAPKVEDDITDPPEEAPNTPGKYKEFITTAAGKVASAREYLTERGIPDEIIKSRRLGFAFIKFKCKDHNTGENPPPEPIPAVIFPYNMEFSYYQARSIDGKFFDKPYKSEAGAEPIYNPEALANGRPVFIVESPLDALAVRVAGGNAAAICGAGHAKLLKTISKKTGPIILFLDHDEVNEKGHRPGQEEQAKIAGLLRDKGIPYREAIIDRTRYTKAKDANDLLRSDPEQFKKDIEANERAATCSAEAFLLDVMTPKYKPIPTGIKSIDRLLKGGFIPQMLALLGGEAGTGKTLLACLIFESMAKSGRRCLYFNLEMAREQLMARSIARRVYLRTRDAEETATEYLTALDVLQGYKWTDKQRDLITAAVREYGEELEGKLDYNPGELPPDLDAILEYLEEAGAEALRNGEPAPCVCLDYLHLLNGKPGEEPASVLKRAVAGLKEYAIKYNTVVLAIQATSRQANRAKEARLDAGRDTSALEYSGDVVLQLKRDPETNALYLCVVKSRFTETNTSGEKYIMRGGQSFMEPAPDKWEVVEEEPFEEQLQLDMD